MPFAIGYTAASGIIFDLVNIYFFLVMFFWQMPHFWTLAIRYREDYARGEFPILPVRLGKERTIYHISFYVLISGVSPRNIA